jgi:hypothetical protein
MKCIWESIRMMKYTRSISASCLLLFDSDQVSKIERMGGLKFSTVWCCINCMHTQANPIPLFIIRLKYHGIFPTFLNFVGRKKKKIVMLVF